VAFRGTFDHTLDAKNRLTIPAKFRSMLANGVVLSKQPDGQPCLGIWRPEDHDDHTKDTLSALAPSSPRAASLRRFFFASSHDTELDGAGRVMIPPFLIEHAGLKRDVVILGLGEYLEVWDRDRWSEYDEALPQQATEVTAALEQGR
jgi:MraZ protein